ncbi:MAG: hypothetical protein IJH38_09070 [Clostridia bacterium]|nr:hypothetical protein [Clostridia bacterium]
MRRDFGRRLFLALAAGFLLFLVWLCLDGTMLRKLNAENLHGRKNESLYLQQRDHGITYIGGQGVLYGEDFMSLVEGEGNKNEVTNLIIGDGITEIGYNVLIRFEGLETLKLGKGIKCVDIGAVKWCTALQYVYLPAGLEQVGRDFLYSCNKCLVITEGSRKDLPSLRNVKKSRLFCNVHSLEALKVAVGEDEALPPALAAWWP